MVTPTNETCDIRRWFGYHLHPLIHLAIPICFTFVNYNHRIVTTAERFTCGSGARDWCCAPLERVANEFSQMIGNTVTNFNEPLYSTRSPCAFVFTVSLNINGKFSINATFHRGSRHICLFCRTSRLHCLVSIAELME